MPIASQTSRDAEGGQLPHPGSEKPKRERNDNTIAYTRSLLFSYIEGGHLPHHEMRKITEALELLDRDSPEDAEALSRFHEKGDKTDRESEARAVTRLAECIAACKPWVPR